MNKVSFEQFLAYFEEIELPITLTEDLQHTFDKYSLPLPVLLTEEFIHVIDHGNIDEFTEYIPCFKLDIKDNYECVVYWRAGLLSHEFHMATYSAEGKLIDHAVMSGIKSVNDKIIRSVATISEELIITIAQGMSDRNEQVYDPTASKIIHLEIMPNGRFIYGEE